MCFGEELPQAELFAARAAAVACDEFFAIGAMYQIERELREAKAGPALREAVRSSQTRMIVDRLFKAMIRLRARELPGNAMAKALDYCLERREGLSRFLGDRRIKVDSNLVENAIRPCALGRKNWPFI